MTRKWNLCKSLLLQKFEQANLFFRKLKPTTPFIIYYHLHNGNGFPIFSTLGDLRNALPNFTITELTLMLHNPYHMHMVAISVYDVALLNPNFYLRQKVHVGLSLLFMK